jgi:hypothetical protein
MKINHHRALAVLGAVVLMAGMTSVGTAASADTLPPSDHVITYNVIDADGAVIESTVGDRGPIASALEAEAEAISIAATNTTQRLQPQGVVGCGNGNLAIFFHPSVGDPVCFDGTGIFFVEITNITGFGAGDHWLNVDWSSPGSSGNYNAPPFSFTQMLPNNWTAHSEDRF